MLNTSRLANLDIVKSNTLGSRANLLVLAVNEFLRTSGPDGFWVLGDDERGLAAVVVVQVFEGTVGGLGVEEVDDGEEDGVCDGEDDPEFPAEVLDSAGGDFDNDKVGEPVRENVVSIL